LKSLRKYFWQLLCELRPETCLIKYYFYSGELIHIHLINRPNSAETTSSSTAIPSCATCCYVHLYTTVRWWALAGYKNRKSVSISDARETTMAAGKVHIRSTGKCA